MKLLWTLIIYAIVIILIGGFHMYGQLTDIQASLMFIGIFAVPFGLKLLFLPRKKAVK